MSSAPVLIVPACERGRGGGHLSRSLFLLASLRERGREAFLWIPENSKEDIYQRFSDVFDFRQGINGGRGEGDRQDWFLSRREELAGRPWDFIVLDRFRTSSEDFTFWAGLSGQSKGSLIGIDEGGPCRRYFDFLIDLLPAPAFGSAGLEPNLSAPFLLPLPRKRRPAFAETNGPPLRVLISFGAEDARGLGYSAARSLSEIAGRLTARKEGMMNPADITLIDPARRADAPAEGGRVLPGVNITGKVPDLRERLAEYDLLITHFGLGAFEAVYARLPVLLISPTAYHERLSRNAGFFSLGIGEKAARRLGKLRLDGEFLKALCDRGGEIARRFGLEEGQKEDMGSFIDSLVPYSPGNCPVCGEKAGRGGASSHRTFPVLARFRDETYRRCKRCGIIYLSRLTPPPIEYEKDYFFDLYKKQYGKTYLEDFPNLMEMGRKRLEHIKSFLRYAEERQAKPALLDIGCAYGPFLAAAAECGFSPFGIEPAEDAVRYIKEELGFPVWHGFFPGTLPGKGGEAASFDVITLWYVIEHFREPGEILREIHRLLKAGGVLAFSTPSFSGISGRKNLRTFLKNSPSDHFTVFSPDACKGVLRRYGFRLRKIVVTGHHPERFPLLGRFARPAKKTTLYKLLMFMSRVFRLGDTFEVYAVKISQLPG